MLMGHSGSLFLYFRLFNTVDSIQLFNKFCQWLEPNRRPLALEATALPTEPQPLPLCRCLASAVILWILDCFYSVYDAESSTGYSFNQITLLIEKKKQFLDDGNWMKIMRLGPESILSWTSLTNRNFCYFKYYSLLLKKYIKRQIP